MREKGKEGGWDVSCFYIHSAVELDERQRWKEAGGEWEGVIRFQRPVTCVNYIPVAEKETARERGTR